MSTPLASLAQPRVLGASPSPALFIRLGLRGGADPRASLRALVAALDPERAVLGVGAPLAQALGASVPGLRAFETVSGVGVTWPAAQGALWMALHGGDQGTLLHEALDLLALLPDFTVEDSAPGYQHRDSRDLSGYIDGTANPEGEEAVEAALHDGPAGLAGGSFLHAMRWVHDLDALRAMRQGDRDLMIGRRISDNEEIEDAPESAHVKRTAQEDVGVLLRRSMPWGSLDRAGLMFLAYSRDPDVFQAHARRMVGLEDGVVDALHRFSRPVSGGLYWCPPVAGGRLDLSALGITNN